MDKFVYNLGEPMLTLISLFIMQFEGYSATVYKDPVGIETIGYGHTGEWKSFDDNKDGKLDKAEALELLKYDVSKHMVHIEATVGQKAALTSLAFNIGIYHKGIKIIVKLTNEGKYLEAADEFLKYNKAKKDGKYIILPGLTKRRKLERSLFLEGI